MQQALMKSAITPSCAITARLPQSQRPSARGTVSVRAARQDAQQPPLLKLFGAAAAAQLTLFPIAGAALADQGNLPQAGSVSQAVSKAGKAAVNSLPDAPDISNPRSSTETAGTVGSSAELPKSTASNAVADVSAEGDANLPSAGKASQVASDLGKKAVNSLPNAPDLSNPKGSKDSSFPTVGKVAEKATKPGNPLVDTSEVPIPSRTPDKGQDVFKQLGDTVDRNTPNPGRDAGKAAGEALNDSNAFSPKDALSKVSKDPLGVAKDNPTAKDLGVKSNVLK